MRDNRPWVLLALAVVLIVWLARDVLGPFVIGGVIAYAFAQPVNVAQARTGWPRAAVIGIGYVIALALIGGLLLLIAAQAASELSSLASSGPDAVASTLRGLIGADSITIAGQQITVDSIAAALEQQLSSFAASPGDAIHLATEAGSFLLDAFLVLVVTFYFLLDGPRLISRAVTRIPADRRDRTVDVLGRVHITLGRWLRGQIVLVVFVAAVVYVVLGPILNVPHALALGIVTGVLELVPLVGPVIAAAISGVVAYSSGGFNVAVIVVVFYIVLRAVEDQLVVPVVIGRAVHLHPVVTIFAVLVGLSVAGILGGLLGVPVAAAVGVLFDEFFPASPTQPPSPPEPPPAEGGPPGPVELVTSGPST